MLNTELIPRNKAVCYLNVIMVSAVMYHQRINEDIELEPQVTTAGGVFYVRIVY